MTIRRFKTGTPARVHKRSIDFDKLEVQCGDDDITPFSLIIMKNLKIKSNAMWLIQMKKHTR